PVHRDQHRHRARRARRRLPLRQLLHRGPLVPLRRRVVPRRRERRPLPHRTRPRRRRRPPTGRPLLTDPGIARYVLDAMLEQERTDKIPGELPAGTAANKTGETDTVSHDLAVVNTAQGRLVVAMVSSADGLGGGPDEVVAEAAAEV